MQAEQLTHVHIAVPKDCVPLVVDLITRIGGQVADESDLLDPMPELARGGQMLKGLRQRAGMTQKQVAEALQIPQSHISEYEKNKRAVPYKHAQTLARLFHSIPSHFMRPNTETLAAMQEVREGKGEKFNSVKTLFADLGI